MDDLGLAGVGSGSSRRAAEQAAAERVLAQVGSPGAERKARGKA